MAFADTTKTMNVAHGAAAFVSAFAALTERFAKYRLYRRTYAELADISPRELADLGLSQHNLRAAAFEAVYGTR
jgi:uncharacterized protein YjiS (DUF1127 family)